MHLFESLGRQLSLLMVCQCITVPRNLYQTMCAKMQEEVCYARPPKALWLRIAEELCLSVQQQQVRLLHHANISYILSPATSLLDKYLRHIIVVTWLLMFISKVYKRLCKLA